jgi:hypothetical protein
MTIASTGGGVSNAAPLMRQARVPFCASTHWKQCPIAHNPACGPSSKAAASFEREAMSRSAGSRGRNKAFGSFEIDDQAHPQIGDAQIIQRLSTLVIGDPFNHLGINYHRTVCYQIGDVFPDLAPFEKYGEGDLLLD